MESSVSEAIFSTVAESFEALGTFAMVAGFITAAYLAIRALVRGESGSVAFSTLRVTLGSAILLGLEILVAADLVRTITSKPSIDEAVILGLIVVIRTILSMSIQIEIEGVLPWKRALLESGATTIAKQVRQDNQKQAQYRASNDASGTKESPLNQEIAEDQDEGQAEVAALAQDEVGPN